MTTWEFPASNCNCRNDGNGGIIWNVTLRKSPLAPPLSKWGMPDIAGRMEGGGGRERDLKGNVYWWT
jgi:hypothetical protein